MLRTTHYSMGSLRPLFQTCARDISIKILYSHFAQVRSFCISWSNTQNIYWKHHTCMDLNSYHSRGELIYAIVEQIWLADNRWVIFYKMPDTRHSACLLSVRLVLATVNATGLGLIRSAVSRRFGRSASLFFVLLTCSQFHLPFWMGRTLPNMFALFPGGHKCTISSMYWCSCSTRQWTLHCISF